MSTSTLVQVRSERSATLAGRLADYLELTKPRILTMVLVTVTLTTLIASWGQPDLLRLVHTLIGTTLVAASASVFNQWLERTVDRQMRRTMNRPLPTGRLGQWETFAFGSVTVLVGLAYLLNTAGRPATFWAAATWLFYVGLYTPLKTKTWLNTVVGAIPGAMPVLIGWTGSGAELDTRALCLFWLVFLWQFPHFMAIAWIYRRQYADAGMQMLTVVDPSGQRAGRQSIVAAISMIVVSLIPAGIAMSFSPIFVLGTLCLGLGFLYRSIQFASDRNDATARRLLRSSLIYLPLQFGLVTLLNLAII